MKERACKVRNVSNAKISELVSTLIEGYLNRIRPMTINKILLRRNQNFCTLFSFIFHFLSLGNFFFLQFLKVFRIFRATKIKVILTHYLSSSQASCSSMYIEVVDNRNKVNKSSHLTGSFNYKSGNI